MSQTHRRAARIDSNQANIVNTLRQIPGVTVELGHDDILVGYKSLSYWFEIKRPGKEKQLKPSQIKLLASWTGHYQVVSSVDQRLQAMGINENARPVDKAKDRA